MLRLAATFCSCLLLMPLAKAAPAIAGAVSVPFTLCAEMICLKVRLADGMDHVLLLDTGNISSWLMADTARAFGLRLDPIEQDGKIVPGIFRLGEQTVSLDGRAFSGSFLAFGREQTGKLPNEVEGAIAYTLFKNKVLQLDYPHLRIRVLDGQTDASAASGAELKLITFGKQGPPIVVGAGFSVNGRGVNAQIDTCYTGTLLIYDAAIAGLQLEAAAAHGRPKYFPYTDGGVNMNHAEVANIAFGRYVLARRHATVYFSGPGKNPVHQPDNLFEATAGNALFAHSVVTLDFQAMRIRLQPGS
jgi:hypothetical protein